MLLIISKKSDFATSQVASWLAFYHKKFVRINAEDNYSVVKVDNKHVIIERNGVKMNLLEFQSYWYRRNGILSSHIGGKNRVSEAIDIENLRLPKSFITALQSEAKTIIYYIYSLIESSVKKNKHIGSYFLRSVNKLNVINLASEIGLLVPTTGLVSSKEGLLVAMRGKNIITKAAHESIYESENTKLYVSYTSLIKLRDLTNVPEYFMTSLVQDNIIKKYELRIFYLKSKMFACAIFSQKDKYGKIDSRRSLFHRYLPYTLPIMIRKQIDLLMKKLKLDTGSIDMIVNSKNQYVFLEVNPVGQFVDYGQLCNYYLDRELAKQL